jgi:D-serine deaminase-like pyridoxal phosphate-dependent protein
MPATPYLRVDGARLWRNIDRTAARAAAAGVALRPHVKTHKSPEIARMQRRAGAAGITVATIGEAEVFVEHGCDDILIAYPVWVDDASALRLRDLAGKARLAIGIDSIKGAGRAGLFLGDTDVEALVEVDSGQHRSGAAAGDAGAVAAAAQRAGLRVRGVFTFPGHSYAVDGPGRAAADEARTLREAAGSLRAAGIEPTVISGGSTPSLEHTDTDVVTELRPGVYVFGDAQQWELGTMQPDDIALTCRSTVISHAGGRLVLDAGSKALGADRAAFSSGFGRLPEHPDARLVLLAEHHVVADLGGAPLPPLGSQVDVVPNHVCNAVNLTDTLHVEESGNLWAWSVAARGRND